MVPDCFRILRLAVSPDLSQDEALLCFRVDGSVFFRTVPSFRLRVHWTSSKRLGRTTRTMVLSETRHVAGLTLLRVLRGRLWLATCLGETAGRAERLS